MQPDANQDSGTASARAADTGSRAPLHLSVLALVTALIAALVSVVALARTGDRVEAAPTPTPSVSLPGGPPADRPTGLPSDLPSDGPTGEPTEDPTPEPTGEPTGGPDPSGVYTVAYEREVLRLQPSTARYIDVDEPSANARSGTGEFTYNARLPVGSLEFDGVDVAETKNPAPTARDCVLELRRAPIDSTVVPSRGKTLCVVTSRERSANQGIRQKVVLLRMDNLTDDGTLNVTLTAWNVPR